MKISQFFAAAVLLLVSNLAIAQSRVIPQAQSLRDVDYSLISSGASCSLKNSNGEFVAAESEELVVRVGQDADSSFTRVLKRTSKTTLMDYSKGEKTFNYAAEDGSISVEIKQNKQDRYQINIIDDVEGLIMNSSSQLTISCGA